VYRFGRFKVHVAGFDRFAGLRGFDKKTGFKQQTVFSVHVHYMSSSVRLSSVTFVRPTQAIETFANISTPFGTVAIRDLSLKILRRSSQGNPSIVGVKHKKGSRI